MTRVYTVKSNARRDCRKLGIDPALVYSVDGGWAIRQPKPSRISNKTDKLLSMLADWTPVTDLMTAMGWQAHTVRGALSTVAKTRGIKVERQRAGRITSYRIAQ